MKTLLVLLLLFPAFSFAEVHKCNDSGHVVYSASPCMSGSMVYHPGSVSGASERSLTVSLGPSRTYNIKGFLNDLPVDFIIDTGASFTSIAGDVAYSLGVKTCVASGFINTAAGVVSQCRVNMPRLTFGSFQFSNIPVVIMPSMRGTSLIGNDLLSRFRVEQSGGVLTLSR